MQAEILPFEDEQELAEMRDLLLKARNLNSAVKSYLKHETQKSDQEIRFLKAIRKVILPGQQKMLERFLIENGPQYPLATFILLRHAYFQELSPVVSAAIEGYAEAFNATYRIVDNALSVQDRKGFEEIIVKVAELLIVKLKELGENDKRVLHRVFLHLLYEPLVVEEAAPLHFAKAKV